MPTTYSPGEIGPSQRTEGMASEARPRLGRWLPSAWITLESASHSHSIRMVVESCSSMSSRDCHSGEVAPSLSTNRPLWTGSIPLPKRASIVD